VRERGHDGLGFFVDAAGDMLIPSRANTVAFVNLMLYGDISINFPGLHIRWYPILPSTCEGTSQGLGHHGALPRHIERVQNWISRVKSGGSWNQVLTWTVVMNAGTATGILLICAVLGLLVCKEPTVVV